MSTTPTPISGASKALNLAQQIEAYIAKLTPIGFGLVGLFFHNKNSQMQLQGIFTTVEGVEGLAQVITPIIGQTLMPPPTEAEPTPKPSTTGITPVSPLLKS